MSLLLLSLVSFSFQVVNPNLTSHTVFRKSQLLFHGCLLSVLTRYGQCQLGDAGRHLSNTTAVNVILLLVALNLRDGRRELQSNGPTAGLLPSHSDWKQQDLSTRKPSSVDTESVYVAQYVGENAGKEAGVCLFTRHATSTWIQTDLRPDTGSTVHCGRKGQFHGQAEA
jgi:hypothetical protein